MAVSSKSNYRVYVSKQYQSYIDLYCESHISFTENGGYIPLSQCKSEEVIWEMLSNSDPEIELENAQYLAFYGLSISVTDYGKCKKCGLLFEDECSKYLPKHCTGCGTKRLFSKTTKISEASDADYELIRKGNWEASSWSEKVQKHFKKKQISRYWTIDFNLAVEFDFFGKTLAQVEKYARSEEIWLEDYDNLSGAGALPIGICSKCDRDFMPREKFCPACGSKRRELTSTL